MAGDVLRHLAEGAAWPDVEEVSRSARCGGRRGVGERGRRPHGDSMLGNEAISLLFKYLGYPESLSSSYSLGGSNLACFVQTGWNHGPFFVGAASMLAYVQAPWLPDR